MSFNAYKLKANNQKKKKHQKVDSEVTLCIQVSAATLTGCVTFSESLNLSLPQFPKM